MGCSASSRAATSHRSSLVRATATGCVKTTRAARHSPCHEHRPRHCLEVERGSTTAAPSTVFLQSIRVGISRNTSVAAPCTSHGRCWTGSWCRSRCRCTSRWWQQCDPDMGVCDAATRNRGTGRRLPSRSREGACYNCNCNCNCNAIATATEAWQRWCGFFVFFFVCALVSVAVSE